MAKPQIEDGHTRIANEIMENLMRMHLSPSQWQVLLCIIRKTYGFQKKVDYIANSQIVDATGLGKTVVSRTLHKLSDMNIIIRKGKVIGLQKDWEKWQKLAESSTSEPKEPTKTVNREDSRVSQSHKLATWQAKVFHRDNLTCRICGRDANTLILNDIFLHSHHILSWEEYPEIRFDINNGLTLCDECHYCYHYADNENTYEYINKVFEFRKLAEQLTIEKLAILHEKVSNSVVPLAKLSTKVSSSEDTQKKKETITKETIQKKEDKQKYGEFNNVLLTYEEYQKLQDKFGKEGANARIKNLSLYLASKGNKYKSHYATILAWEHRDQKEKAGAGRDLPNDKQLEDGWYGR